MNRRKFIGATALAAGGLTLAPKTFGAQDEKGEDQKMMFETPKTILEGEMIYRTLGSTGEKISALGMGGFHLSKPKTDDEAIKLVRTAIDRGITFMDNCWDYADGFERDSRRQSVEGRLSKKGFSNVEN